MAAQLRSKSEAGADQKQLEARNWAYLATLPIGSYGQPVKYELCVQSCDGCKGRHALSLRKSTTMAATPGMKPAKVYQTVIDRLVIESDDVELIKQYPPFDPNPNEGYA